MTSISLSSSLRLWHDFILGSLATIFVAGFVASASSVLDCLLAGNIIISTCLVLAAIQLKKPTDIRHLLSLVILYSLTKTVILVGSARLVLIPDGFGLKILGDNVPRVSPLGGLLLGFVLIAVHSFTLFSSKQIARVNEIFILDTMSAKGTYEREWDARLQEEADFIGCSEGAGKFLKADSVITMVFAAVSLLGLLLLGILYPGERVQDYLSFLSGLLLINSIFELLVSTALALSVSRACKLQSFDESHIKGLNRPIIWMLEVIQLVPLPFLGSLCCYLSWVVDSEEPLVDSDRVAGQPASHSSGWNPYGWQRT